MTIFVSILKSIFYANFVRQKVFNFGANFIEFSKFAAKFGTLLFNFRAQNGAKIHIFELQILWQNCFDANFFNELKSGHVAHCEVVQRLKDSGWSMGNPELIGLSAFEP